MRRIVLATVGDAGKGRLKTYISGFDAGEVARNFAEILVVLVVRHFSFTAGGLQCFSSAWTLSSNISNWSLKIVARVSL